MPRIARKKTITDLYHVMLRGADGRIIFADDEDCLFFINRLLKTKNKSDFNLYAYCLMGNHVHMLLKENEEPLEIVMKRLGVSYVHYYNWKYQLHGHLFQDRFRSECIETDSYFLDVLRYIFQNPVKAGLCANANEYPWVGCSGITENDLLLDPLDNMIEISNGELLEYANQPSSLEHLEDVPPLRLTDREAIKLICNACCCENIQEISSWDQNNRSKAIQSALGLGVSIRQLSRITAISRYTIEKVSRNLR